MAVELRVRWWPVTTSSGIHSKIGGHRLYFPYHEVAAVIARRRTASVLTTDKVHAHELHQTRLDSYGEDRAARPSVFLTLYETIVFRLGDALVSRSATLRPQYLLHSLSPGELVDQLVQVANFPHGRFFYVFDLNATNFTGDLGPRGIHFGCFGKEGLKVRIVFQQRIQRLLAIASQPTNDFIDFFFRSSLLLSLRDVMGIDTCDTGRVDTVFGHDFEWTPSYRFQPRCHFVWQRHCKAINKPSKPT